MGPQKTMETTAILRKMNKVGELTLSDIKQYCKVIVIKQHGTNIKTNIEISGTELRDQK